MTEDSCIIKGFDHSDNETQRIPKQDYLKEDYSETPIFKLPKGKDKNCESNKRKVTCHTQGNSHHMAISDILSRNFTGQVRMG